jgi:hypothetical protein
MGTTTGWRRNTSFVLARKEQEEDGCNGIGFSSKRDTKTREKRRSNEGGVQSAIIHIFSMEAY